MKKLIKHFCKLLDVEVSDLGGCGTCKYAWSYSYDPGGGYPGSAMLYDAGCDAEWHDSMEEPHDPRTGCVRWETNLQYSPEVGFYVPY